MCCDGANDAGSFHTSTVKTKMKNVSLAYGGNESEQRDQREQRSAGQAQKSAGRTSQNCDGTMAQSSNGIRISVLYRAHISLCVSVKLYYIVSISCIHTPVRAILVTIRQFVQPSEDFANFYIPPGRPKRGGQGRLGSGAIGFTRKHSFARSSSMQLSTLGGTELSGCVCACVCVRKLMLSL